LDNATPPCLNPQASTDRFPHRFPTRTFIYCYHYPVYISHLRYLQLLCKLLVKISHSCSTVVPNKEFKIIVVYTFEPPISIAFFTYFSRISLSFTMASSKPNSPSDSKPKAIPESSPTLLSLYNAPLSLYNAIPESLPTILSLYTFPLPPLD
jgi:hypothetical protein